MANIFIWALSDTYLCPPSQYFHLKLILFFHQHIWGSHVCFDSVTWRHDLLWWRHTKGQWRRTAIPLFMTPRDRALLWGTVHWQRAPVFWNARLNSLNLYEINSFTMISDTTHVNNITFYQNAHHWCDNVAWCSTQLEKFNKKMCLRHKSSVELRCTWTTGGS